MPGLHPKVFGEMSGGLPHSPGSARRQQGTQGAACPLGTGGVRIRIREALLRHSGDATTNQQGCGVSGMMTHSAGADKVGMSRPPQVPQGMSHGPRLRRAQAARGPGPGPPERARLGRGGTPGPRHTGLLLSAVQVDQEDVLICAVAGSGLLEVTDAGDAHSCKGHSGPAGWGNT